LYVFIALMAFGAGIWVNEKRQADAPEQTASQALFALALPDLQGQSRRLEQWRGKVLVVNFWATWCAPCREEIPIFVGISIDEVDKTREFATTFKMNYPVLIGTFDTVEVSRQAGNKRRVLPYTVILNRKGEIVATELGGVSEEKLESMVKPLL
jgi:thiol-disulfide isomerase/thioredoxin